MPSSVLEAGQATHDRGPDDAIVILRQCANADDRKALLRTIVLDTAVRTDIAHAAAAVSHPQSAVARGQQRVDVGGGQPAFLRHEPFELDAVETKQAV